MCDVAGNAAAAAVRFRNRLRGSFMKSPPQRAFPVVHRLAQSCSRELGPMPPIRTGTGLPDSRFGRRGVLSRYREMRLKMSLLTHGGHELHRLASSQYPYNQAT